MLGAAAQDAKSFELTKTQLNAASVNDYEDDSPNKVREVPTFSEKHTPIIPKESFMQAPLSMTNNSHMNKVIYNETNSDKPYENTKSGLLLS